MLERSRECVAECVNRLCGLIPHHERHDRMRVLDTLLGRSRHQSRTLFHTPLEVEVLERRELLDATPTLVGNTLTILGGPNPDYIGVIRDLATDQLVVTDGGREVFRVASAAVNLITVNADGGNDVVVIARESTAATKQSSPCVRRSDRLGSSASWGLEASGRQRSPSLWHMR